ARTVTLGPVEGGRATGTVTAEVSGLPVKFNADLVLQDADGATSLSAKSAVAVKIPMMGSMLEPKIMEWAEQIIAHESSLIEKYLKENAYTSVAAHAHNLRARSWSQDGPIGVPTRGTTGFNRLRKADRWLAHHPAVRTTF